MEDFLVKNPMYVVCAIVLVIWLGIAWYLLHLNSRIVKLERSISTPERT